MKICLEKEKKVVRNKNVVTSFDMTQKLMKKLSKLKLLGSLDEHVRDTISIIIEETLDGDFEKLTPRAHNVSIVMDKDIKIKTPSIPGRLSKFKIHLLEVGDTITVDKRYNMPVHQQFNYHIEKYQPSWGYKKSKEGDMVMFTRVR